MQKSQLKKLRAKEKSLARQLYGNMDAEQQGEDSSNEIGEKKSQICYIIACQGSGVSSKNHLDQHGHQPRNFSSEVDRKPIIMITLNSNSKQTNMLSKDPGTAWHATIS